MIIGYTRECIQNRQKACARVRSAVPRVPEACADPGSAPDTLLKDASEERRARGSCCLSIDPLPLPGHPCRKCRPHVLPPEGKASWDAHICCTPFVCQNRDPAHQCVPRQARAGSQVNQSPYERCRAAHDVGLGGRWIFRGEGREREEGRRIGGGRQAAV